MQGGCRGNQINGVRRKKSQVLGLMVLIFYIVALQSMRQLIRTAIDADHLFTEARREKRGGVVVGILLSSQRRDYLPAQILSCLTIATADVQC